MRALYRFGRSLADPAFRPTALRVALVVGSTLFLINHGSALVKGQMSRDRWIAGLLTYLVPYTVSIHGQHISRLRQQQRPKESLGAAEKVVQPLARLKEY